MDFVFGMEFDTSTADILNFIFIAKLRPNSCQNSIFVKHRPSFPGLDLIPIPPAANHPARAIHNRLSTGEPIMTPNYDLHYHPIEHSSY